MSTITRSTGGFRVSLRTLMIGVVVIGASLGLLGRLSITTPRLFVFGVSVLSTLVPYLLAIGTIIWVGFRSKRLGLAMWGVWLVLMPVIGTTVMYLVALVGDKELGRSPWDLTTLNTERIIKERLPNQIDDRRCWEELQRRIHSGSLTAEQADAALNVLIAHLKTEKSDMWAVSNSHEFVKATIHAGLVPGSFEYEFLDTCYGTKPIITMPRIRENSNGFEYKIQYRKGRSSVSGAFQKQLVWGVDRVLLDGDPIETSRSYQGTNGRDIPYSGSISAGEHKLEVEIEAAYIDRRKLIGLDVSSLPKKNWPVAAKRWKKKISKTFTVYSSDEEIIDLSVDPAHDPLKAGAVTVERLVAQADPAGGSKLILKLNFTRALTIPVSFDVIAKCGDETIPLGQRRDRGCIVRRPGPRQTKMVTLDSSVKRTTGIASGGYREKVQPTA